MSRMVDVIARHLDTATLEELRRGPLSRDRALGLRTALLARAGTYRGGGGDGAAAAVASSGDVLEDALFHVATERMQERQEAPVVAVDFVLSAVLAELAAGARP